MKRAEKCIDLIAKFCGGILIVIGSIMPILTFANAVLRKLPFAISMTWADEVCRYGFIYMTYVGMVLCTIKGRHACVDLIFEKIHGRAEGAVKLVGNILTVLFLAIMLYGAMTMLSTAGITASPILRIPLNLIYFSLVFGSVLTMLVYLWKTIQSVQLLIRGKEGG